MDIKPLRGELFNLNEFPVDTHVNRVMLRLNIASKNDSPKDLEQKLVKLYSGDNMIHFHRQVITFGREICINGFATGNGSEGTGIS